MTIVFSIGDEFWIDVLQATITLSDTAGIITGPSVTLTKPGNFLWANVNQSSGANNDATRSISQISIRNFGGGNFSPGEFTSAIEFRTYKQISTAGSIDIDVFVAVFLRGTHVRV